jgi:NADH:ubiquinone oxidoreductase subunit C
MEAIQMIEKLRESQPGAVLATADRFGQTEVEILVSSLGPTLEWLKTTPGLEFDMLVDLVSIDYSAFPGWKRARFGLAYLLKSLKQGHRLQVKTYLSEENPQVPTSTGLWANANHLEREAFDQMGIRFTGHPNLKRILNHHEFVGHPLRKDYPITRRQWLSNNQSLMDEMEARLKERGLP